MRKSIFVFKYIILLSAVLSGLFLYGCNRTEKYQDYNLDMFDTVTSITGYAESREEFDNVAESAFAELEEYNRLYDIYNDYEGVNNIKTVNDNAGNEPVKVDKKIIDLLKFAKEVYEDTGGLVNVAMGSVLKVWHEAREISLAEPELAYVPDIKELKMASEHTDITKIIIDEVNSTVFLEDSEMSLDVGALAKGYALQMIANHVPDSYLISVGGNVYATSEKPDGEQWSVGIQNPDNLNDVIDSVDIKHGAAVTSGDYQRYYESNGKRYHHIIDPRTLMPADYGHRSVTIVCDDSSVADALSTALFMMNEEDGAALLAKYRAMAVYY